MAATPKTTQRIYCVTPRAKDAAGNQLKPRLVWAPNVAQAVRHVAADSFDAHVATHADLARLMAAGVVPELTGDAATREAQRRDQQQLANT